MASCPTYCQLSRFSLAKKASALEAALDKLVVEPRTVTLLLEDVVDRYAKARDSCLT